MSKFLQFELLDSVEIRKQKSDTHDAQAAQLSLLPVDPMQEKYNLDRIILSGREFEIMSLVLNGHSIQEISKQIFLSISGVKFRLSSIYWKFDVKNRLELIKKSTKESLQFYVDDSPIKHAFHNRLSFAEFKEDKDDEPTPS